ncbi:MAG: glucosamine-6-phosphate deaminase [Tepidisphaeraceae bacterium]
MPVSVPPALVASDVVRQPPSPDMLSSVEKAPVSVYTTSSSASHAVAKEIADLIRSRAKAGQRVVLGLATGSTPTGVYGELVRMHKDEGLSFKNVVTFNLDEYFPMKPDELQSYVRFMNEHLFDHIDIDKKNVHVPDGTVSRDSVWEYCQQYEQMIRDAGGIDLQLLGIGRTGHVGFNEPGSGKDSKTRLITLDRVTRLDAASDFFGEENVPRKAITMGVGTILAARKVILMAWGEGKARVVARAVEGEITTQVAASFLQQHPNARFILDTAAAAELTRFKAPWLLGSIEDFGLTWDAAMTRRAAIWLASKLGKPLLKLTNEDYNEHHLQDLIASKPTGAYELNIDVFRSLQATITGWPGGKPASASSDVKHIDPPSAPRFAHPKSADVFPKRVVLFSPHPDDDVISMGGTFIRLCDQGHEVHVAYQTSGNIAVFDAAAIRHADFVQEFTAAFGFGKEQAELIENKIKNAISSKKPGEVDPPELQKIKGLIRRTEAKAGAMAAGVKDEARVHFLDLPFYETGRVRKSPPGEADYKIAMDLLDKVQPHQNLRGRRSVRPARHAPALSACRVRGAQASEGSEAAVAGPVRAVALPRRVAGVGHRRNRNGRSARAGRGEAEAARDLQARKPERPRDVPRFRRARVLATRRRPQPRHGRGVRQAGPRRVRGDRRFRALERAGVVGSVR